MATILFVKVMGFYYVGYQRLKITVTKKLGELPCVLAQMAQIQERFISKIQGILLASVSVNQAFACVRSSLKLAFKNYYVIFSALVSVY